MEEIQPFHLPVEEAVVVVLLKEAVEVLAMVVVLAVKLVEAVVVDLHQSVEI
jgi:hypothetical protein